MEAETGSNNRHHQIMFSKNFNVQRGLLLDFVFDASLSIPRIRECCKYLVKCRKASETLTAQIALTESQF